SNYIFVYQAEDGIRDRNVTGVQTCALPILEMKDMLAPPPVKLPEDPALAEASSNTPRELAAKFPASPYAWAVLAEAELAEAQASASHGEQAEPSAFITAYAFARTGYHRGLDRL